MAETEAKKEAKSIEDTFGELDWLARKLEDKETPLEESFRLYRQGMELLKNLNGRLDTVEKKMLQKKLHEWIDEETGGEDDETTI